MCHVAVHKFTVGLFYFHHHPHFKFMCYILSKLFCEKKGKKAVRLFNECTEAVQILVKNKFEITDEEVSLLHVECVLSRIALNDGAIS